MHLYGCKRCHSTDSEKRLARELRQKTGLSYGAIGKMLGRSYETIRQWTFDIALTKEQYKKLKDNSRKFMGRI